MLTAQATAFIFDKRTNVFVKMSKFLRQKNVSTWGGQVSWKKYSNFNFHILHYIIFIMWLYLRFLHFLPSIKYVKLPSGKSKSMLCMYVSHKVASYWVMSSCAYELGETVGVPGKNYKDHIWPKVHKFHVDWFTETWSRNKKWDENSCLSLLSLTHDLWGWQTAGIHAVKPRYPLTHWSPDTLICISGLSHQWFR